MTNSLQMPTAVKTGTPSSLRNKQINKNENFLSVLKSWESHSATAALNLRHVPLHIEEHSLKSMQHTNLDTPVITHGHSCRQRRIHVLLLASSFVGNLSQDSNSLLIEAQ